MARLIKRLETKPAVAEELRAGCGRELAWCVSVNGLRSFF
jgi:hypothetical protein